MSLMLRRRASALATLLSISTETFHGTTEPLGSASPGLRNAPGASGLAEPRTLFGTARQRQADIFDRLEL